MLLLMQQQQMKRHGEMLNRKPMESLLCLSDAYRGKVETLESLKVAKVRMNPRPELWERTLCDGRSFANNSSQEWQLVGRADHPAPREFEYSMLNSSTSTPFIQLLGTSKLIEETKWLSKSPYKHLYTESNIMKC